MKTVIHDSAFRQQALWEACSAAAVLSLFSGLFVALGIISAADFTPPFLPLLLIVTYVLFWLVVVRTRTHYVINVRLEWAKVSLTAAVFFVPGLVNAVFCSGRFESSVAFGLVSAISLYVYWAQSILFSPEECTDTLF